MSLFSFGCSRTMVLWPRGSSHSSDGDYENEAVKQTQSCKASRSKEQEKPGEKWKEFHGLEISTIDVPPPNPPRAGSAVSPAKASSFKPPNIGLNLSSAAVETAFRAPPATPPMSGDPIQKGRDRKLMTCLYFLMLVSWLLGFVLSTVAFLKLAKISEELERLQLGYSDTVRNVSETQMAVRREQAEAKVDMQRALRELQDDSMTKGLADARKDREKIRDEMKSKMEALRMELESACTLCRCQPDWHWIQGSCYFFSTDMKSWEGAQQFCITESSHLVILKGDEARYLLEHNSSRNYWIGLSKKGNNWIWIDGTPLTVQKWNQGEPNNIKNREHCAEMYISGNWNDLDCSDERSWICEKH